MQKFNGSLIRQFPSLTTGNAAAGVQVSVFASGTNNLATLYATNNVAGAQLSNPLTTDGKGFYAFFAVDGRYRLEYNNGFPALELQLVDVIDINAEVDAAIADVDAALVDVDNTISALTITAPFDFNTGGTVTARNQVVLWSTANGGDGREYRWAGALPKTVPPASTPAGTGGISGSAWVYTADVALEQALAAVDSTTLVGGIEAGDLASQALYSPTTSGHTVIDLHYGALRGRGLPSTETTSVGLYDVASSAAVGSTSITLTANSSTNFSVALVPEQMITYLGDDGEYYAAAIFDIVGNILQLKAPIEAAVSAGVAKVTSFQANEAHPNEYGYRAIADYALRVPQTQYKRVSQLNLDTQVGSASISISSANDINNTGSGSVLAKSVTCPTAGADGISGVVEAVETGAHTLSFVINGDCSVVVSNGTNSTTTQVTSQEPKLVEIPCFVSGQNRNISVVISAQSNGGNFILNQFVDLLKVNGVAPDLNKGTHVMLGDSWFQQEGIWERLQVRLPNATIINQGIGGERADQMAARFSTDVAPYKPDVVWFIAGTNEYYQGVEPNFFSYQVNRIKSLCAEIGAHLMLFTCSVGSAQLDAARFDLSRRLATETDYFDTAISPEPDFYFINIQQQNVANGSTVQLANLGSFDSEVIIEGYYINGAGMKIGRKSSLLGLPTYLKTFDQNTLVSAAETLTYSGPQFIEVTGENTSGVSQDYLGYIKIRKP